jgi:predicted DNA-binding transcriptional regulator AlpA
MNTDPSQFNSLPDSALVSVKAFPVLAGIAVSTAWRRAKLEPDFPQPVRLGVGCTRFRVGDIRRFLKVDA